MSDLAAKGHVELSGHGSSDPEHPKVLILGHEPMLRGNMRVVLASMGCRCVAASGVEQALGMIEREGFDAVVFDPRCTDTPAPAVVSQILERCPRLRGRVILMTGASGEKASETTGPNAAMQLREDRVVQDLWPSMELLFRTAARVRQIFQTAQLVFDSLFQPLPAGLRTTTVASRRLVFEAGTVILDLSIEPQENSERLSFVGQILDSSKPELRYSGAYVVLHGEAGPTRSATSNKHGEFRFDCEFEAHYKLEVEIDGSRRITLVLPELKRRGESARA